MAWSLKHTYQFSEGIVAHDTRGSGPPVVLVHGTPWSSYTWRHVIPALAENFTVYYYDLIGYGNSEMRDDQNVSLGIQNVLLAELLDHWGLEAPRVVAHDFGGATVLRTHILGKRAFDRIALMNVVALAPWGSPFFKHVQHYEAAFSGVPPYIHKAIVEAYIRTALFGDLDGDEFDGLVTPWLSDQGQPAFYRQIAQADQKYTDEVESRYITIDVPVSILWGADDRWIPIATGERLHRAIPGSTFQPVPQAGHLVQLDQPHAVIASLQTFLA